MRPTKYKNLLKELAALPLIKIEDTDKLGIPKQTVYNWAKEGVLEKVYPGIYRSSDYEPQVDPQWENLAILAASIPNSTICLISALCYYELTDQIMRECWIAIPHSKRAPKRAGSRIIRMRNFSLGREEIQLGEYTLHIYDRERTIIDAFRYLSKEISIKALREYLLYSEVKPQVEKLRKYARELKVKIDSYILTITT